MTNSRGRSLRFPHPFSFVFIRGEVGFEKNKKNNRFEVNPGLGKIPGPPCGFRIGEKVFIAARTRDVVENNTQLPAPTVTECDSFNYLPPRRANRQ
jgi:hypothetical protein